MPIPDEEYDELQRIKILRKYEVGDPGSDEDEREYFLLSYLCY